MQRVDLVRRVAIGDIIRRSARRYPGKVALVDEKGRKYTYAEFNAEINRCAHALHNLGLEKGDRVATVAMNSGQYIILMYGAAKAGLTFTPINPGLSEELIFYTLNHSEARVLVVDDILGAKVADMSKATYIEHQLKFDISGKEVEGFKDFHDFIKDESDEEFEQVEIWERDISKLLYTSGTTAEPKGALLSHLAEFVVSLSNMVDTDVRVNDVVGSPLPLFHCGMLTVANSVFHIGATWVLFRHFEPQHYLGKVQDEKITYAGMLPMMFRALLAQPNLKDFDLLSMRTCVYGMAPMDRATLEKLIHTFGAELRLTAGMTEVYPVAFTFRPEDQLRKEGPYWGISTVAYDAIVVDDEGNPLPPGQAGELLYRGPGIMEGYLKDEESTANAFRGGWFHSGDIGRFDEEGQFVFMDRKKDMIKTGGENVPSIKVENALLEMPEIENAAVVGLPHDYWMEAITAFVVAKKGKELTEGMVIDWCKSKLSGFEVPKKVVVLDSIPLTTTGKIMKYALREEYKNIFVKGD